MYINQAHEDLVLGSLPRRKPRTTVLFNVERKGQTQRLLLWALENVIIERTRRRETQAIGDRKTVAGLGSLFASLLSYPPFSVSHQGKLGTWLESEAISSHTGSCSAEGANLLSFFTWKSPLTPPFCGSSGYCNTLPGKISSTLSWGDHLADIPTEQETSLSKTASWQDKAEGNTKLIAPILPLSC